jgi:hypothetical protein
MYFLTIRRDQRLFVVIALEVNADLNTSVVPSDRLARRPVVFRIAAYDCENSASKLAKYHARITRYLAVPVVFVPTGAKPYLNAIVSVRY